MASVMGLRKDVLAELMLVVRAIDGVRTVAEVGAGVLGDLLVAVLEGEAVEVLSFSSREETTACLFELTMKTCSLTGVMFVEGGEAQKAQKGTSIEVST